MAKEESKEFMVENSIFCFDAIRVEAVSNYGKVESFKEVILLLESVRVNDDVQRLDQLVHVLVVQIGVGELFLSELLDDGIHLLFGRLSSFGQVDLSKLGFEVGTESSETTSSDLEDVPFGVLLRVFRPCLLFRVFGACMLF